MAASAQMLDRQVEQFRRAAAFSTTRFVRPRRALPPATARVSCSTRARSQSVSLQPLPCHRQLALRCLAARQLRETGRPHLRAAASAFSGCARSAERRGFAGKHRGKLNLSVRIARRRLESLSQSLLRIREQIPRGRQRSPRWRWMTSQRQEPLDEIQRVLACFLDGPGRAPGVV